MNKLAQNFVKVEKSIQIVTVIAATLFLGFVAVSSFQSNNQESAPVISPTTQQ